MGEGRWRVRGMAGGLSCTGREYLYIYIYKSGTPLWLRSGDKEPVCCNGMTGCLGGQVGEIGFFCRLFYGLAAPQFLSGLPLPPPLIDTVWLFW